MKRLASVFFGICSFLFVSAPYALTQTLPTDVLTRHITRPATLGGYFDISFAGIPAGNYDVSNGTLYRGWCIENRRVGPADKQVLLYSSLDPNLPLNMRTYQDPAVPASGGVIGKRVPWNELNWLLNNRLGYTMVETQYAIHRLIYGTVFPDFINGQANGEILYQAASTQSTFVPAPGQIIAIVLFRPGSEGIATTGEQDMIIELVKPPNPHLTVVKTPDGGVFSQGGQVSFTIVVSNDGGSAANNVELNDQLPTNGGLSWISYTATAGVCTISISSLLHCSFGTIQPGDSVSVTVKSDLTTPPEACQPQNNPHAVATASGGLSAEDSGSLLCTPLLGSLGDRVWHDIDGDGVQDAGENGLVGWTVTINGPGGYTASMNTGANGIYGFFNLPAGTYQVCVTPMPGYTQTYDLDGLGTPHCATRVLGAGENATDVDFGYRFPPTVGLGDYVWSDVNGNGVQDATEVGINGVTVNLYACAAPNTILQTTVTANNPASPNPSKDGYYSFTGLAPGCYVVGFVNPGGHIFTIPFLGGNTATDSNANQTTGRTPNINLVSGFDPTIDAGLVPGIDLCPPPGTTLPGDGKAGKLYIWQDADHVYARLDQSRNLNDNSYGTNIVQWTRSHTFSNLVGSDKAQFIFKNTTGNVVLDFYMDYITAKSGTPSGYASLGVTGGEGKINIGLAAWVVDSNTSIAQNLNDLGFCVGGNCSGFGTNLLLNSPPTVSSNSYDLPPGSPYTGWEFTNSYYVKVSKAAFGGSALGSLSIGEIHNSPPKTGDNAITPVPCIPGGECNIVEGTHEIKDRNLKWLLTNNGDVAAILTKLTLTWPEANGMLKKVKFDGDVVWDDGAPWTLAGITLDTANFTTDPKKKRIDPGKTRVFTLEFEKNAAFFPYQLKLIFDSGCEVDLEILTGPPTELAACSELKPIEQMVLQYSGVKTISSVSWFRTTVSDINNPGTANLIGTASGADIGITPYSFGNFAAASSTNDVDFVLTFTDDTKQRSRFHLSCSDPEMNDITDCGKLQGNAKDNSVTGGNLWTLRDLQGKGLQMCNYP